MPATYRMICALFLLVSWSCQAGTKARHEGEQAGGGGSITTPYDEEFLSFLDACFETQLRRDPNRMAWLGIRQDQDRWTPLSDEYADETREMRRGFLERLKGFDTVRLNASNRLNYRLFQYELERDLAWDRWRKHSYPLTQMRGVHTSVPSLLMNMHPIADAEDADNYIARLEAVFPLFVELLGQLHERERMGVVPPRFVYAHVIGACRNVVRGRPFTRRGPDAERDSDLLADFSKKIEKLALPPAQRDVWIERAETALATQVEPAYRGLIEYLEQQGKRADDRDGAWKLPDGAAYYGAALQRMTTTVTTAESIHEIGLREVARIQAEMRQIQEQVGFRGSMQEFFAHMRTDPSFYYPNDESGRAAYLERAAAMVAAMKERLTEVFGTLPKADMIVKAVEPYRSASAGKAFYNPGAPDGSRPGIYYANLHNMADMPIYQMEALAYHEGIPGHHMQNSIARELEGVPRFRRFGGYTAYGEGWALYTEYFPKEMGFYEDPYSDFGRLAMELWRACRLVVDTGLHHYRWRRQQAIDYLMENTPNPEGDCVKAIERYIVMPGQATAYKVGMLKILELRERARQRLGERFDLRGFHDTLLTNGPVPLQILEELVDEWIAAQPRN